MQNQNILPHLKYNYANPHHPYFGCIEADGKVIHRVKNMDDFYSSFGYTAAMRKAGVLPDEFVWAEYIKESNAVSFATCMQVHIAEYLIKNSAEFREKYSAQCESFLAAHAVEKLTNTAACAACRTKPFCGAVNT